MLNEVIWFNRNIQTERIPGIRRDVCIAEGIVKVSDIYDSNRQRMMSANQMAISFDMHPLPCQSLIKSIPEKWRGLLNAGERITREESKALQEILETKKVVRWAYLKSIRKIEGRPIACNRWREELELPTTYKWDLTSIQFGICC